jgi:hypothetical protein
VLLGTAELGRVFHMGKVSPPSVNLTPGARSPKKRGHRFGPDFRFYSVKKTKTSI